MNEWINPSQQLSVFITLRELERRLRQALTWLQGVEEQGRLYSCALTLSPQRRDLVEAQIAEALAVIEALAQHLSLEPQAEEAATYLRAELSASWADLCDIRSAKLRRYGAVHPHLASVLDAPVEHLAELALTIAQSLQAE